MTGPHAANEAPEGREALVPPMLLDEQALVDVPVAAYEVGERFIGQQRDMRLRIVRPQRPQHRRHEHEVADMHHIYDQDILIHH